MTGVQTCALPIFSRSYSDYPDFTVRVESLEEIFAQKLRALVQRKKVRDYYDVWKMGELEVDAAKVARIFLGALAVLGAIVNLREDAPPMVIAPYLASAGE